MCLDLLLTVFIFYFVLYALLRLVTVNEYGILSMLRLDRSCSWLISFSGWTVCVCVGGGGGGSS